MEEIPVNISIFEFEFENDPEANCRGVSHDTKDNAVQMAYDMLIEQGIKGEKVKRIYSEWQPSAEMLSLYRRKMSEC